MIKLLTNRYVMGAVAVLALLAAMWGLHYHGYRQGVTDTKTAAKIAAYEQYKAEVAQINAASYDLQQRLTEIQNAKPEIITEYKRVVVQAPLPATCRIDAGRLRNITGAINKANAAGKSGKPMP